MSWRRILILALALVAVLVALGGFRLSGFGALPTPPSAPHEPSAPPVASMGFLPADVQAFLVSLCNGCTFADSNADWNAADVILDDRLPRRRLTRTERRGSEWIIEYEHGGVATFEHRLVLSVTSPPAILAGSSCVPEQARTCSW